jgi:hypothetical protein
MNKPGPLVRVRCAEPIQGFRVLVAFDDDTQREIDLGPFLHGPIFEPIRHDMNMFGAMKIEAGAIAW